MRSETLEEVELTGVRPSLPAVRTFSRGNTGVEEVYVDTDNGPVCVAVQGDRSRPPILTYHDLGLNCKIFTQLFTDELHRSTNPLLTWLTYFLGWQTLNEDDKITIVSSSIHFISY